MRNAEIPHGTARGYRLEYNTPGLTTCAQCRAAVQQGGRYNARVRQTTLKLLKRSHPNLYHQLRRKAVELIAEEYGMSEEEGRQGIRRKI